MSDIQEFEKHWLPMFDGSKYWSAEKEGDQIFGTVVRTEKTERGTERFVLKTSTGELSLPGSAVITRLFAEKHVVIGDTVLVRFTGMSEQVYFGKPIRVYGVAVKHADGTWG